MKILYYDCFSGLSGDMNLGAMIDLGMPADYLRAELAKLNIEGFEIEAEKDSRHGIGGTRVTVRQTKHEHVHRHLSDIHAILDKSELSERVIEISKRIFYQVAEAEAKVHNQPVEKVHFHEVGALDSIADIVGASIGFDYFDPDAVYATPITTGSGFVKCAHGTLPVPAPATAEILKGMPHRPGNIHFEATTPTGAAILKGLGAEFPDSPEMSILRTGYGIGQKINEDLPNMVRLYLAEISDKSLSTHTSYLLECNVDDMKPEWFDLMQARLFDAGMQDVYFQSIQMKKNRPGHKISVICTKEQIPMASRIIFRDSTSLGLRIIPFDKITLERREDIIDTPIGKIAVKRAYYEGREVSIKAEYEDCRRIAEEKDMSLKEVYRLVEGHINAQKE